MNFKEFLTESEKHNEDVQKTLGKIPQMHSALVKGYKIKFQPGNTLKGDDGHIGFIDEEKKTITIASPWNYGREYTLLHEIAHAVWKYIVTDDLKENWHALFKAEKKKDSTGLDQGSEEIFCMTYAQHYAHNKMVKFAHPRLVEFIKKLPK